MPFDPPQTPFSCAKRCASFTNHDKGASPRPWFVSKVYDSSGRGLNTDWWSVSVSEAEDGFRATLVLLSGWENSTTLQDQLLRAALAARTTLRAKIRFEDFSFEYIYLIPTD